MQAWRRRQCRHPRRHDHRAFRAPRPRRPALRPRVLRREGGHGGDACGARSAAGLRQDTAKAFFDQRAQGDLALLRQRLGGIEKRIGDFNRGLHMGPHTFGYGSYS